MANASALSSDDQMNATKINGGPPPFHTFVCQGESFVYDTSHCRFFRVDEITRQFLEACRSRSLKEAEKHLLQASEFSRETIKGVSQEVEELAKFGLFDVPDYSISAEQMERQLDQRYKGVWNKLELALSEACNLACTYSYCGTCRDMPHQGMMSETVARQAITWLFAVSGRSENVSITFFGGEPLLNKPVLRFAIEYSQRLAQLHGKKVFYSMTTNGTLLDDEVIGFIKRYNFGLMVSLDGPPEIHNAQCPTQGGNGSFDMAAADINKVAVSPSLRDCSLYHDSSGAANAGPYSVLRGLWFYADCARSHDQSSESQPGRLHRGGLHGT